MPGGFVYNREDHMAVTAISIGRRLQYYRELRGLSRSEVARRAGIHWGSVGRIENGRRGLSIPTIQQIAKALDVPAELIYLSAGTGTVSDPTTADRIDGENAIEELTNLVARKIGPFRELSPTPASDQHSRSDFVHPTPQEPSRLKTD